MPKFTIACRIDSDANEYEIEAATEDEAMEKAAKEFHDSIYAAIETENATETEESDEEAK